MPLTLVFLSLPRILCISLQEHVTHLESFPALKIKKKKTTQQNNHMNNSKNKHTTFSPLVTFWSVFYGPSEVFEIWLHHSLSFKARKLSLDYDIFFSPLSLITILGKHIFLFLANQLSSDVSSRQYFLREAFLNYPD